MVSEGPGGHDTLRGRGSDDRSPGRATESTGAGTEPRDLADLIDRSGEGVVALDREWRFTYVSAGAAETVQRSATDLIGAVLWEAFPRAVGSSIYHHYQRAMSERVPVIFEEYSVALQTWLEERCMPTDDGGLLILFHDISR